MFTGSHERKDRFRLTLVKILASALCPPMDQINSRARAKTISLKNKSKDTSPDVDSGHFQGRVIAENMLPGFYWLETMRQPRERDDRLLVLQPEMIVLEMFGNLLARTGKIRQIVLPQEKDSALPHYLMIEETFVVAQIFGPDPTVR